MPFLPAIITSSVIACTSMLSDGCSGAPPSSKYTVQYPNFFTGVCTAGALGCARQSGQTYNATALAAINWLPAGISYPVGPNINNIPGGSSQNPAGIGTDATVCAACAVSPCTLTGQTITCTETDPIGSTVVINGYDLSGICIETSGNPTGDVTIENSKIFMTAGSATCGAYFQVDWTGGTRDTKLSFTEQSY